MSAISKHIIFHITIVESNVADHAFLRQVIHKVVPQAIVDSVYSGEEADRYFDQCSLIPQLIFLGKNLHAVTGKSTMELIKGVDRLAEVPVIFLQDNDSQTKALKQEACHFYLKPFGAQDLLNIVGSVNSKWLA